MFPGPWTDLPDFRAHDWPAYAGETSLTELATTLVSRCEIQDGDILVGCSLGGMVAAEITKQRRIPHLFLVGSALHPAEVGELLRLLHPFSAHAPWRLMGTIAGWFPGKAMQMFARAEPAFVRAMCGAIFRWPGAASPATRVWRIHGRRDLAIPPPPNADLLLNAGHLAALTHSPECVAFVRSILAIQADSGFR